MKSLFFHEDDYCQVELLPLSAFESSTGEMDRIDAFAEAHWDGVGWTGIYLRQDQSQALQALGISISALAAILDPILEPVEEVYTGYSTYREHCLNTWGWCLPCHTALLAEFDNGFIVKNLWIVNGPPTPETLEKFQQALQSLHRFGDLFIADWNLSIAVPCTNDEQLRKYLSGDLYDDV